MEQTESTQDSTALHEVMELDDDDAVNAQKDKYLTFRIASEDYGIEIRYVTEIVVMQQITQVPDMPKFIKGVINLRGTVISVLDMRSRFHLEEREYDDRTCIIVVNVDDLPVGLIVDSVNEVVDIPIDLIDPPPKTHSGNQTNYIVGMGKIGEKVKILLNVKEFLSEEDLHHFQETVAYEPVG